MVDGLSLAGSRYSGFSLCCSFLVDSGSGCGLATVAGVSSICVGRFCSSVVVKGFVSLGKGDLYSVNDKTKFPSVPLGVIFPSLSIMVVSPARGEVGFLSRLVGGLGLSGMGLVYSETSSTVYGCESDFSVIATETIDGLEVLLSLAVPFMGMGNSLVTCGNSSCGSSVSVSGDTLRGLGSRMLCVRGCGLPCSVKSECLVRVGGGGGASSGFPEEFTSVGGGPLWVLSGGVNGVVTVTGRGNKINGAAAAVGLNTTLTGSGGGALVVSLSSRTGTAVKLNVKHSFIGGDSFSILASGMSVISDVCSAAGSCLGVVPSSGLLTGISSGVESGSSGSRVLLGGNLGLGSDCSCVLLSYPPSLKLVVSGTLFLDSSMVVPISYSCFTCSTLARVIRGVGRVRGSGGSFNLSLAVSNMLLAGLSGEGLFKCHVDSGMGSLLPDGACGAVVDESDRLRSTPVRKGDILSFTCGSQNDGSCVGLTGSVVSGGGSWVV